MDNYGDNEETRLLPGQKGAPTKDSGSGPIAGFVQLLLANLGPGILTLPYIFTVGGIAATGGMLCFVLGVTLYSMWLVLKCKYWLHASPKFINVEYSKRPQSFQDIGREILGTKGEKVITVFVVLMQLGICMVFLNFSAENLLAVEHFYIGDENVNCLIPDDTDITTIAPDTAPPCNLTDVASTVLPKSVLVMCVAPIPLLLTLGRSPAIIVVSASGATVVMFIAVGTVLFLVAWHFSEYFPGMENVQIEPKLPGQLPIVFGNLLYSVTTAIGVLLPIENTLNAAGRAKYPQLVFGAMSCHFVLFLMVGMLSNLAFGKQTEASITAEFIESNIGHPIYISIVNCFLSLSVLLTFPLQFRPACEVVEKALGVSDPNTEGNVELTMQETEVKRTRWQKYGFIVVRTGLVVVVAGAAASVPQLDLIVSLAGSFVSCVLAMMVPPAMDLMIMRIEGKFPRKSAFFDVLIIFVGVIGLIGGTGSTFLEIIGVQMFPEPSDDGGNTTETITGLFSPWTLLSQSAAAHS
eukprot:m.195131 g.195131  ORF g.195131 m.195131 type:complete len:522 (-) comp32549_c0_seq1:671-2236(-)